MCCKSTKNIGKVNTNQGGAAAVTAVRTTRDRQLFWRCRSSSSAARKRLLMLTLAKLSGAIMASNCRMRCRMDASLLSRSPCSCSEPSSEMPLSENELSLSNPGRLEPYNKWTNYSRPGLSTSSTLRMNRPSNEKRRAAYKIDFRRSSNHQLIHTTVAFPYHTTLIHV